MFNKSEPGARKHFLSFVSFHIIAEGDEAGRAGRTGFAFKSDIKKTWGFISQDDLSGRPARTKSPSWSYLYFSTYLSSVFFYIAGVC